MDQRQHMTKTEAHPYHHGRGCKVFDPNCPLCRDDPNRETTYVSWSLHQTALDRIKRLEEALENCVPMMHMAWKQYGVGGMFECMDAARTALRPAEGEQGDAR